MIKIINYLTCLIIFLFIVSCSKNNEEIDKVQAKNIAGLYKGNNSYLYLYPDQTGIRHNFDALDASDVFKWTMENSTTTDIYVEYIDSTIIINNLKYDKILDYSKESINENIIGVWELENIKIISPAYYDKLFDRIEYSDNAKIVEFEKITVENALSILYYCNPNIIIEVTRENVLKSTLRLSASSYPNAFVYKSTKNKLVNDFDMLLYFYELNSGKLVLNEIQGIYFSSYTYRRKK